MSDVDFFIWPILNSLSDPNPNNILDATIQTFTDTNYPTVW